MPYTAEQIGPVEIRPISLRTKDRLALVLVQHGHSPGYDETQVTLIAPCTWRAGRRRTLELVSRGVDLSDIRAVEIPDNFVGDVGAGDGQPLHHADRLLWWTVGDDIESDALGSRQDWALTRLKKYEGKR